MAVPAQTVPAHCAVRAKPMSASLATAMLAMHFLAKLGSCTCSGTNTCDAAAYYDGWCTRQGAAVKTIKVHFACIGGQAVDATFVNGPSSRVRLALSDGRTLTLPQVLSGSGAQGPPHDDSCLLRQPPAACRRAAAQRCSQRGSARWQGAETQAAARRPPRAGARSTRAAGAHA
ncbi:MliC family protein [Accumulibacter sp.]|uniref:MliC family protein n=1 Tax=Accumulibacter sp. TaxID=2053492 RepID=UPI0033905C0F